MRVEAQFEKPEDMQVTMTVTMSLEHWITLQSRMRKGESHLWPASDLMGAIDATVNKVKQTFLTIPNITSTQK